MKQRNLLFWIIYLIFFAVLNETVFNVSTPNISEQFALTPSGVSWMMTIFLVFFGIGSVIYGRLSDIYSLRLLIIIGIVIYNIGSVIGFVCQFSYPLVILGRAIQGMGASAIPALIFVIVARQFEPHERGKIFGIISSIVSVAIGLGPVIGGFVSGAYHWSILFLIPLLMLIAIPFLKNLLPNKEKKPGSIDILGAVLVALTVGTFVLFLNYNEFYYFISFIISLFATLFRMRYASNPFIQPSLFKNIKFRNGVIVGFCLFSIVIGILFLIPLLLHDVHKLNTSQIGMVLFPGAISSVIFGPIGGSLADKKGNNFVVIIGLTLLTISILIMSVFLSISALVITAALLFTYVGFSLFQIAIMNSVSQTLPEQETGVGMGIFNLIATISGAVGTALAGKILDGHWFDTKVLPTVLNSSGYAYSNILLLFSLVVVLGGIIYLYSFRTGDMIPNKVKNNHY